MGNRDPVQTNQHILLGNGDTVQSQPTHLAGIYRDCQYKLSHPVRRWNARWNDDINQKFLLGDDASDQTGQPVLLRHGAGLILVQKINPILLQAGTTILARLVSQPSQPILPRHASKLRQI